MLLQYKFLSHGGGLERVPHGCIGGRNTAVMQVYIYGTAAREYHGVASVGKKGSDVIYSTAVKVAIAQWCHHCVTFFEVILM